MKIPSLTGTLGEAFRVCSGNATVLIVENFVGEMPPIAKAKLQVGEFSTTVAGVDFPGKNIRRNDDAIDLVTPMIGLLIEGDIKEQLIELKGRLVEVFEI